MALSMLEPLPDMAEARAILTEDSRVDRPEGSGVRAKVAPPVAPPKAPSKLPPFESLLKSRDVEDPVNLWFNRPLAYAFVALIYRTRLTPNQVTVLATLVGVTAGAFWLAGTPLAMLLGGIVLWTAGILDGADGILARAKSMQSEFGRALDGSLDFVVVIVSLSGALAHLWLKHHDPMMLLLVIPAFLLTLPHIYLYDFYKESYLRMTRPGRGGECDEVEQVVARVDRLEADGAPWLVRFVMRTLYVPLLINERRLVGRTNPAALHTTVRGGPRTTEAIASVYRAHNAGPMRLWTLVSLAPHTYLLAICAMFDRLDVYLWVRLVAMNAVFVVALVWQRRASERTLLELTSPAAAALPVGEVARAARS